MNATKDLTNFQSNDWTVIKEDNQKRYHWICRCKCGREMSLSKYTILKKTSSNCQINTCSSLFKDLSNKRFGRLLVVSYAGKVNNKTSFNCICDCGVTKVIHADGLVCGKIKSCGCLGREHRRNSRIIDSKIAAYNQLYFRYRSSGNSKNLGFKLNKDEFFNIIQKNCHYCGKEPNCVITVRQKSYFYNGIDRINNMIGYEVKNCISCCKTCNFGKSDSSYDEWIDHLKNLVEFRKHL
jgi:hypothetical protein